MSLKRPFSVFLTPQGEDFEFLKQIIKGLSQKYKVQSFEPHITVYSGEYTDSESLKRLVAESLPPIKPFSLEMAGVEVSPIYSKTFYIKFKMNYTLNLIYQRLNAAIPNVLGFELEPHLSLLYKNTSIKERETLLSENPIRKQRFNFNEIKLVSPSNPIEGWKDTSSWEVLLVSKLE